MRGVLVYEVARAKPCSARSPLRLDPATSRSTTMDRLSRSWEASTATSSCTAPPTARSRQFPGRGPEQPVVATRRRWRSAPTAALRRLDGRADPGRRSGDARGEDDGRRTTAFVQPAIVPAGEPVVAAGDDALVAFDPVDGPSAGGSTSAAPHPSLPVVRRVGRRGPGLLRQLLRRHHERDLGDRRPTGGPSTRSSGMSARCRSPPTAESSSSSAPRVPAISRWRLDGSGPITAMSPTATSSSTAGTRRGRACSSRGAPRPPPAPTTSTTSPFGTRARRAHRRPRLRFDAPWSGWVVRSSCGRTAARRGNRQGYERCLTSCGSSMPSEPRLGDRLPSAAMRGARRNRCWSR